MSAPSDRDKDRLEREHPLRYLFLGLILMVASGSLSIRGDTTAAAIVLGLLMWWTYG